MRRAPPPTSSNRYRERIERAAIIEPSYSPEFTSQPYSVYAPFSMISRSNSSTMLFGRGRLIDVKRTAFAERCAHRAGILRRIATELADRVAHGVADDDHLD